MPCQSYDSRWDDYDSDRDKIRELKKQADMLARIACKALQELEDNKISEVLLLRDDEVREWWAAHKEADRKAREAKAELERRERVKAEALARLSAEEKELLGLARPKRIRKQTKMVDDIEEILYRAIQEQGDEDGK